MPEGVLIPNNLPEAWQDRLRWAQGRPYLHRFDTVVSSSEYRRNRDLDTAYTKARQSEIVMSSDTRYVSIIHEPRFQKSPLLYAATTALGTYPTDTYNLAIASDVGEMGMYSLVVGPEENHSISLTESAHNMHAILDNADELGFWLPNLIVGGGDSRGAMIMNGVMALNKRMQREIVDAFIVDPCLAERIQYWRPRVLGHYATKFGVEVISLGRQIGRMPNTEKIEHIERLDFSPARTLRTGLPLRTGEAGDLAQQLNSEQKAHVVLFLSSLANQYKVWQRIYAQYSNVSVGMVDGSHLSLLRRDIRRARQGYLEEVNFDFALAV